MLTTEEITKVYAMYLGGKVRYADCTWDLRGVDSNEIIDTITISNPNDGEDWTVTNDLDNCRLILTDLSDITDEDAIELCRLYYPLAFQGKCPPSKWEVKRDMILDCHYRSIGCNGNGNSFNIDLTNICMERYDEGELCESGYMLPVIDFLRSRSYHLPYKGINLFESGIAITHKP